jgi:hypothetical protein
MIQNRYISPLGFIVRFVYYLMQNPERPLCTISTIAALWNLVSTITLTPHDYYLYLSRWALVD